MNQYKNRIQTILNSLSDLRYTQTELVKDIFVKEGDYTFTENYQIKKDTFRNFHRGETWGGTDRHFWFYTILTISESYQKETLIVQLNIGATDIWNTDNPQLIAYVNGKMRCAMDLNHNTITLSEDTIAKEVFELSFYAYSNSTDLSNFFDVKVLVSHAEVEELYYDMRVLFEAVCLLKDDEIQSFKTIELLNQCMNLLDLRCTDSKEFFDSVKEANRFIKQNAYIKKPENSDVVVHSVGHTHIDVAWKWQLKQTRLTKQENFCRFMIKPQKEKF
ncbi:MAG: hypothetical protein ACERKZ_19215 [Lachnotalea sp.]